MLHDDYSELGTTDVMEIYLLMMEKDGVDISTMPKKRLNDFVGNAKSVAGKKIFGGYNYPKRDAFFELIKKYTNKAKEFDSFDDMIVFVKRNTLNYNHIKVDDVKEIFTKFNFNGEKSWDDFSKELEEMEHEIEKASRYPVYTSNYSYVYNECMLYNIFDEFFNCFMSINNIKNFDDIKNYKNL